MFKRKNKRLLGLFLFVCFCAAPRAEANPIACQDFTATRSGDDVLLRMILFKDCHYEAPALESILLKRDLFVQDLDFVLSDDDDFAFVFEAVDSNVSFHRHIYGVSFESSYEGWSRMSASVEGADCASLDVSLGEKETILKVSLKSECISDPDAGFDYIVTRYSEVLHPLEWSELDAGSHMECTAIHYYDYDGGPARYAVGVRSGDDTFYATFNLMPHEIDNPGNGDPDWGIEDPDDQMQAAGGTGCNVGGNSNSGHLPLFLFLFAPLLFWRRRKTG